MLNGMTRARRNWNSSRLRGGNEQHDERITCAEVQMERAPDVVDGDVGDANLSAGHAVVRLDPCNCDSTREQQQPLTMSTYAMPRLRVCMKVLNEKAKSGKKATEGK